MVVLNIIYHISRIKNIIIDKKNIIDKENKIIINSIDINNKTIYLAIGGEEKINYKLDYEGKLNESVKFISENNEIVDVSDDGVVKGVNEGATNVRLSISNKVEKVKVVVTNLITVKPDEYNYDKPYLTCNIYSKEQNDLLDEILKNRVNSVGFKTRAS